MQAEKTWEAHLHLLILRDEEQWVAICLDLGVVTQGDTLDEARDMIADAIIETVADDIVHGFDPLDRPKSDDEMWQRYVSVQKNGKRYHPGSVPVDKVRCLTGRMHLKMKSRMVEPENQPVSVRPPAPQHADLCMFDACA